MMPTHRVLDASRASRLDVEFGPGSAVYMSMVSKRGVELLLTDRDQARGLAEFILRELSHGS